MTRPRLLVVNAGLLGARTFGTRLLPLVAQQARTLEIRQLMLSDRLSAWDRLVRRAMCQRFWTDRWRGVRNLDLARYRTEWHTGLLAGRRLRRAGSGSFDALMFYRQPSAYASLQRMRRVPSIVAIDATQACIAREFQGPAERATLLPSIRRDGRVFAAAASIIASSQWAADSLRRLHPRCRTPIAVIPPPVDLDAFDEAWMAERTARADSRARARVLFVGDNFERKGGFLLLDAWRNAGLDSVADLDLVTNWPLRKEVLPPRVVLHRGVRPYSQEWCALWRAADLFVMPTRYEAFGMVFQEAAAAGLAAIGTRENAVPEIVEQEVTGLLFEPGDAAGLVRALRVLTGDPHRRSAMGRAARARALGTMGIATYAAALERLVLPLLEGQPRA